MNDMIRTKTGGFEMNQIDVVKEQMYYVVRLKGRIKSYDFMPLKEELYQDIKEVQPVILNLTELKFIDTSGLTLILSLLRWCNEGNAGMVSYGANEFIKRIFGYAKIPSILPMVDTCEEAIILIQKVG